MSRGIKIAIAAAATAATMILGPIVAAAADDEPPQRRTPIIQPGGTVCDWGWQHECPPKGWDD